MAAEVSSSGFLNRGSPGEAERAVRSMTVADRTWVFQEQWWPSVQPHSSVRSSWGVSASRAGKQAVAHHAEVCAGRALKLCQLDQGEAVPDGEKAMASLSSPPTMTDTAVQRELQWDPAATWVSATGCALLSGSPRWQQ